MTSIHGVGPGTPDLLGATPRPDGVNFALFSYHASEVELLLFDRPDDGQPAAVIPLDPDTHRIGSYWHVFVPGLKPGQLYGYRLNGPYRPEMGLRFDPLGGSGGGAGSIFSSSNTPQWGHSFVGPVQ